MADIYPFKINGVDIIPFILAKGIEWSRNDVDSDSAGELEDGTLRRDRIIIRRKAMVPIKSLYLNDMVTIQQLILPQWVSVEFFDLITGKVLTRNFYSNNIVTVTSKKINGRVKFNSFSFPLIEQGVAGEGAE